MDPFEAIREIVAAANMLRNDDYENVSHGAEIALNLAEHCEALGDWVKRDGFLPGDTMPWDGGNDKLVSNLIAAIYREISEERYTQIFANGIRLAELVTMTDTNHIV